MQIKDVLKNNNCNSNSIKTLKPIAIVDERQVDYLLDQYQDLYPAGYRAWHAKIIKQYGTEIWERLAKTARVDGKSPQRYFSWLLKRQGFTA